MSVDDVVIYLDENNVRVAAKTIYGWENDSSCPNINTFLLLCKKYDIKDILKLLVMKNKNPPLILNIRDG